MREVARVVAASVENVDQLIELARAESNRCERPFNPGRDPSPKELGEFLGAVRAAQVRLQVERMHNHA